MTQDEIIEITRQAGGFDITPEFLARFAKLVAEHEREECALIGDGYHDEDANCGDLIRARGQQ